MIWCAAGGAGDLRVSCGLAPGRGLVRTFPGREGPSPQFSGCDRGSLGLSHLPGSRSGVGIQTPGSLTPVLFPLSLSRHRLRCGPWGTAGEKWDQGECAFSEGLLVLCSRFGRAVSSDPTRRGNSPLPLQATKEGPHWRWASGEWLRANGRQREAEFSRRGFLKWPTCYLEGAGLQGTRRYCRTCRHIYLMAGGDNGRVRMG